MLIVPDTQEATSHDVPTRVHEFRVRKPYASVNEQALIHFLDGQSQVDERWVFVPSVWWYRFEYRDWGSFSVAICSDILDTYIWNWLRGRVQHLFVPAWNQDIDLFDQMTWTRGYELYANVVTVNHGYEGGSVVWTPKSGHGKEIFRVHGAKKGLAVVVSLPVRRLIEAQKKQLDKSVAVKSTEWSNLASGRNDDDDNNNDKFKTPPSNYPRG